MIMGSTKIITFLVIILVYNHHRRFVGTLETTSTSSGTNQNPPESADESDNRSTPFDMQVAGHGTGTGRGKGMLKSPKGYILKGNFSEKEKTFYDNLETTNDPILKELRQFVPRYYGVETVKEEVGDKESDYLGIENLTRDFTLSSIMDVKLGEQTWEPKERKEKIEERKTKYAQMRKHYGFSIPGAQYYNIDTEELEKCERPFTHTMTPTQAIELIYKFFNRHSGLVSGLVNQILIELRKIYSWFERQRLFKFYGSSILIVYDTASLRTNQPTLRVRMIDFSHAVPNEEGDGEKDENYMRGLKNLILLLENLEIAVRKYTNVSKPTGAQIFILTSNRYPMMDDEEQEQSSHVLLPPGFTPFDEIADHVINKGGKKLGFVKDYQGNLFKPDPHQEEIDFYKTLSTTDDPILIELKQYVTAYFGMNLIKIENELIQFLRIENIVKDFKLPCSVNIKIGIKRRPDWAPPEPAERLCNYEAMLAAWKFAIPGYESYKVPVQANAISEKKSRKYTHHTKSDEGVTTLYDFVNGKWGIQCGLVDSLLHELRKIESWFQRQRHYRFYDSSVLLTYDAKRLDDFAKGSLTANDCRSLKIPVRVRMIDFGNTFPNTEDKPDENYLEGLRNLTSMLEGLSTFDPNSLDTVGKT